MLVRWNYNPIINRQTGIAGYIFTNTFMGAFFLQTPGLVQFVCLFVLDLAAYNGVTLLPNYAPNWFSFFDYVVLLVCVFFQSGNM